MSIMFNTYWVKSIQFLEQHGIPQGYLSSDVYLRHKSIKFPQKRREFFTFRPQW